MPVTVSVLLLWNHTALVPVSGCVRTKGCTVGGFFDSSWAFTVSGLPVFMRALLISVFSSLCVGDLQFDVVRKGFVGRTRVAHRCRTALVGHCHRIQHGEFR